MSDQPIGDHALLSNCHSAALIDRAGSVEWWCLPRFDSPSLFARILDHDAGHFSIRPEQVDGWSRRYETGSLVLTTTFTTPRGEATLTDALAMADGVRGHELGKESPPVLLRRVQCVAGEVELEVEFAPRPEYGLSFPLIREADGGLVARGGAATLRVSTPASLHVDGPTARGTIRLAAGEAAGWAVEGASSWQPVPARWTQEAITERIADTLDAWRSWEREHQRYRGPYEELVHLSGRVLQGLTYRPTGAIMAAPTSSLPEVAGGARNWDYRYAWIRDASYILDALWVAACPDEAADFLDYLTTAASSIPERHEVQIMFGIRGERELTERELPWLEGWRSSRPVRVGNGAWAQRQLDVYGALLAAVHRLTDQLPDLDPPQRRLLAGLADIAAGLWEEPDHGIWEMRGEPRHYVHSKLMCWLALDRVIELAVWLDATDRVEEWKRVRADARDAILTAGWSDRAEAFTQTLGGDDLDASTLMIPIVGFLPPDHPRVTSTIDAIKGRLTDPGDLVYRYRTDDGLEGTEGTFLLCTFWLSEALARAGRLDEARQVFDRAVAHVNDVGLLSEQVDPKTGELLGNFPQAFSHVGLVNATWAIRGAERRSADTGERPSDQPSV